MDLAKALMLAALVYVAIEYVKSLVPGLDGRVTQALVFLAAIGAVFLVGETVWAKEQVLGGHTLDTLGGADKLVAGLLIGSVSTVGHRIESAVRSIGTSERKPGESEQRAA